jgi:hypothetical protein
MGLFGVTVGLKRVVVVVVGDCACGLQWDSLGIKYPMGDTPAMSEDRADWAREYMESLGVKVLR